MKILVIDDDTRLLAEMERILTRHGYSVNCADNADDAVSMVGANSYDFILVDYRMPNHDGIWFLKNASLPKHAKALLVTSCVDRHVIAQMFNAGISGYVVKPFDESELLRHLEFHSNNHVNLQDFA